MRSKGMSSEGPRSLLRGPSGFLRARRISNLQGAGSGPHFRLQQVRWHPDRRNRRIVVPGCPERRDRVGREVRNVGEEDVPEVVGHDGYPIHAGREQPRLRPSGMVTAASPNQSHWRHKVHQQVRSVDGEIEIDRSGEFPSLQQEIRSRETDRPAIVSPEHLQPVCWRKHGAVGCATRPPIPDGIPRDGNCQRPSTNGEGCGWRYRHGVSGMNWHPVKPIVSEGVDACADLCRDCR